MMATDARGEFEAALTAGLTSLGITLTGAQRSQLWDHRERVVEANRHFNLTRITGPRDFAIKHDVDGLAAVRWCRESNTRVERVLDIGTGAGVPAVPLAVAEPTWRVTALDGTGKKARFVADVADGLPLNNLSAVHGRAESWRGDGPCDLVVLKAVGTLARCLAWARPHLSGGGCAVVYKTSTIPADEVAQGRRAAARLGFRRAERFNYVLRDNDVTLSRVLWVFRQVGH